MKGVNKCVVEIVEPQDESIERVLVFFKPESRAVQLGCQQDAAEKYVSGLVSWRRSILAAGTGRARRAVGGGRHGRRCAAVVPFVSAPLSGSGENARNPAEIIAKMRYLCYNSLKPAACAAARVSGTRGCAGAHGFENVETRKTAASVVLLRPLRGCAHAACGAQYAGTGRAGLF